MKYKIALEMVRHQIMPTKGYCIVRLSQETRGNYSVQERGFKLGFCRTKDPWVNLIAAYQEMTRTTILNGRTTTHLNLLISH